MVDTENRVLSIFGAIPEGSFRKHVKMAVGHITVNIDGLLEMTNSTVVVEVKITREKFSVDKMVNAIEQASKYCSLLARTSERDVGTCLVFVIDSTTIPGKLSSINAAKKTFERAANSTVCDSRIRIVFTSAEEVTSAADLVANGWPDGLNNDLCYRIRSAALGLEEHATFSRHLLAGGYN